MFLDIESGKLVKIRWLLGKCFDKSPLVAIAEIEKEFGGVDEVTKDFAQALEKIRNNLLSRISIFLHQCSGHYDMANVGDLAGQIFSTIVYINGSKHKSIDVSISLAQASSDNLVDNFALKSKGRKPLDMAAAEFIAYPWLCEMLYLRLIGVATLERTPDKWIFRCHPDHAPARRRRQFADVWEEQSTMFDIAAMSSEMGAISRADFETILQHPDAPDEILAAQLDKVLKLPFHRVSSKIKGNPAYKAMADLARVVFILQWSQVTGHKFSLTDSIWELAGISHEVMKQFICVDKGMILTDRLFEVTESLEISISTSGWRHPFRRHFEKTIEALGGPSFNHIVGDEFEVGTIRNFIQNSFSRTDAPHGHIKFHDGFKPHEIAKGVKEGDIDVIIEDTARNHFYFCQVKYAIEGELPYTNGNVVASANPKVAHALNKQLRPAKKFLESGALDSVLSGRNILHAKKENSSFLLITNRTNLDFSLTFDGIAVYDWNSLRNLLYFGWCMINENGVVSEWTHDSPFPIENPDAVINILINRNPFFVRVRSQASLADFESLTSLSIDAMDVEAENLN